MLEIKKAAALANLNAGVLTKRKAAVISQAADYLLQNSAERRELTRIDGLAGGAGTSFNMNINEALSYILSVKFKTRLSYLDDINKSQSTNDVFPTAVKMAALRLLKIIEINCAELQKQLQQKESEYREIITIARTEYQDAVFMTLGQQFGAWAEAISRDRWRIYKCFERIRVINLGGTAIGTGLNASQKYAYAVVNILRDITGLNLVKAENLIDCTQNCDAFVEISGILKANAATLQKICCDLRFLASGPNAGIAELKLKPLQKGSTIMPAKVNPVSLENIIQATFLAYSLDSALTIAAANGHLQLNPMLPLIAYCIIKELKLLGQSNLMLAQTVAGITPNRDIINKNVENSYGIFTALVPFLGYSEVERLVNDFENYRTKIKSATAFSFLQKQRILSHSQLLKIKKNIIK